MGSRRRRRGKISHHEKAQAHRIEELEDRLFQVEKQLAQSCASNNNKDNYINSLKTALRDTIRRYVVLKRQVFSPPATKRITHYVLPSN